jgi:uncharacterized protein (TIGR02246 family)
MASRLAAGLLTGILVTAGAGSAQAPADGKAAAAALMKIDREFNQAVADRDRARFLSLIAPDATFAGGGDPVTGREAIGRAWAPYFETSGPRLTWTPEKAEVIGAGDLGYTIGSYVRRATSKDGTVRTTRGQYLTIWRKQDSGAWLAVYDTGSQK